MIPTDTVKKPGTPNTFRFEEFIQDGHQVVIKKKASKDQKKMDVLSTVSLFNSTFGKFLSSGKLTDESPADAVSYAINLKKELTGPIGRSPVAYLTVRKKGDEKGTSLCNLFFQTYQQTGEKYLKGTNRDTGEVYYVYSNAPRSAQKSTGT